MSECAATSCCASEVKFDGLSRDYKARLWAAIALNASMFAVGVSGGARAGSRAPASVLILLKYKEGDANVRSVWLCSRNDAIGNIAVMLAAVGVWGTATDWPDVLVAAIIASLFLNSASKILLQAVGEWRLTHEDRRSEEPHGKLQTARRR